MWLHHFAVTGTGEFPLDMLRYDRCSPRTSGDAASIYSSFYAHRKEPGQRFTIGLVRAGKTRGEAARVTVGRWSSFGWQVVAAPAPDDTVRVP